MNLKKVTYERVIFSPSFSVNKIKINLLSKDCVESTMPQLFFPYLSSLSLAPAIPDISTTFC